MQVVEVRALSSHRRHPYTFTFCLERVDIGPYKVIMTLLARQCWGSSYCTCGMKVPQNRFEIVVQLSVRNIIVFLRS